MGFEEMKHQLASAYAENCRQRREDGIRKIPVLSGPSGIGKSACVRSFAESMGFNLSRLDCSYEPVAYLVGKLSNAIGQVLRAELKGCVLLVDNIDQADAEWREIFRQYGESHLRTHIRVGRKGADGELLSPLQYEQHPIEWDEIPEQIVIIGEQRPG